MSRQLIISGGTQGLGRDISRSFAAAGFEVTALYRSDKAAAEALGREFGERGWKGIMVQHDVAVNPYEAPLAGGGEELVVIHNACAAFNPKPLHLLAWEEYEQGWSVAVKGAYNLVYPRLRDLTHGPGGSFVAILSAVVEGDKVPPKGFAAYAVAKQGLRSFTRSLRAEYQDRGLRSYCAYPGFMRTNLTVGWNPRLQPAAGLAQLTTEEAAARIFEHVSSRATPPATSDIVFDLP